MIENKQDLITEAANRRHETKTWSLQQASK